ncbi:MAG TPA: protein-L-isoaspartate O-methyltransferase [Gammaproteobacteria bacterium]|nr:protein-L-isoaspartate O-methyltransferase [Gammaproteobacteria bacterium]
MNLEYARDQMLRQQVRAWEVLDDRVLEVMRAVPRELFVPVEYHDVAFADFEIPLGHGQTMMAPKVEGRLLQSLGIERADRVLEVGTGSGFLTACLARLADSVLSVDIYPDFVDGAGIKLNRQRVNNVELLAADALTLKLEAEFDAIAVTGSVPELDEQFIRMLRPGGRLFIVTGREPIMEAQLVTQSGVGAWSRQSLFETVLAPLVNAEKPEPFSL